MFGKRVWLAAALISALLLTAACGQQGDTGSKKDAAQDTTKITFNGSSTLSPVISKIGTNFTEKNGTWKKAADSLPDSQIEIVVSPGGSGAGVKAVLDKKADFGLIARELKESEKSKIPDCKQYKVGIDALTIAVNPNNPITKIKDTLTSEEIKKIFSGEYKTWNQVDPSLPEKEIIVVTRDIGGGAHEVFQNKIMGDARVVDTAIQAPSMGALVQKIIENENAIGYASFGVSAQNAGKVTALKVDGIEATKETILDGSYKIQRPLIIVGSGELSPIQKTFMDYIRSAEGISVVEDMGFIPTK
jgi:phosphate transport system substrate-binding protein